MGGADGGAAGTLLDSKTCTLQLNGADPARLNLALVTTDVGECVRPGECYVPIDRGPTGWKEDAGRVQLPLFVCKLLSGKNLRLATSTQTCAAKEESSPICRVVEGTGGSSGTSGTGGTSGTSGSSSSGGSSGSSGAGCVGQGCNVPMCKPGVHTTVVGSVTNPTIRARVYVPNGPLPTTCCSSNPKAITLATTDDMGNFTLVDPPVGPSVLIVIEQAVSGDGGTAIGWTALQRNISAPCAANDVGTLPAWDGTPQNGGVCCP